jgi:hypothetical protein
VVTSREGGRAETTMQMARYRVQWDRANERTGWAGERVGDSDK